MRKLLFLTLISTLSLASYAQKTCATAIDLPVKALNACSSAVWVDGDTRTSFAGSNGESGEININIPCSTVESGTGDVWYKVVIPSSGFVTIETRNGTSSPVTDDVALMTYTSCGGTYVTCSDNDNSGGYHEKEEYTGTPGTLIYIRVQSTNNTTPTGGGTFQITAYDPTDIINVTTSIGDCNGSTFSIDGIIVTTGNLPTTGTLDIYLDGVLNQSITAPFGNDTIPYVISGLTADASVGHVVTASYSELPYTDCGQSSNTFAFPAPSTALPNDACSMAVPLVLGNNTNLSNECATTDASDPIPACYNGSTNKVKHSVWYTFTPSQTCNYTFAVTAGNDDIALPNTQFDSELALYSGTCGSFTEIACNDDIASGNLYSSISANLVAGQTYYLMMDGAAYFLIGSGTYSESSESDNVTINISNVCNIQSVVVGTPSVCNDNGTPTVTTDDFYTADVTVNFGCPPSTGNLTISGSGSASVATSSISGTSHTFTGVQFPANGASGSITATFTASPTCTANQSTPAVTGCSFNCTSNAPKAPADGSVGCGGAFVLTPIAPATEYNVNTSDCDPYSISGTNVFSTTCDDCISTIPLPFNFNYYGNVYSSAVVQSNGIVGFGAFTYTGYSSFTIPTPTDPDNFIAGFYADIDFRYGGTITYATVGTAPNRSFVVQYSNVVPYNGGTSAGTGTASFQIVLHENNTFQVIWTSLSANWNASTSGANATTGAENIDGSIAFAVSGRNNADFPGISPSDRDCATFSAVPNPCVFTEWRQGTNQISTSSTFTVNPTVTTTYTGVWNCNGVECTDDVTVTVTNPAPSGTGATICKSKTAVDMTATGTCPDVLVPGTAVTAGTTFNTGVLANTDQRWNRNSTGTSCNATATDDEYYDLFYFQVSTTGSYTLNMCTPGTNWDGHASLYQNAFNDADPCGVPGNFIIADDDGNATGNCNNDARLTANLTAGTLYILVTTDFSSSGLGNYEWVHSGAGNIIPYSLQPGQLQWYTQASGGTAVQNGSPFNPINDPEVIAAGGTYANLSNTNTPGTYNFWVGCQGATCRTPVNYVITDYNSLPSGASNASNLNAGGSGCLNTATNGGSSVSTTLDNTCVPPLTSPISALAGNNNERVPCSGSLSFNSAPVFYTVECDVDGGTFSVDLGAITPTSGTITRYEAALYGPVTASCPVISGGAFVDCDENTTGAAMTLSTPTSVNAGDVYVVLIDMEGGTGTFTLNAGGDALPVELMSFNGKINGDKDDLFWETASEINVSHFELEYSTNAVNYSTIASLRSNNSASNYFAENTKPVIGKNYYRLKMVDNDNSFKYSNVVVLDRKARKISIASIEPNPTSGFVNATIVSPNDANVYLRLFDAKGKLISKEAKMIVEGTNKVSIDLSSIGSGLYLLQVESNNQISSAKIVKE